MAEDLRPSQALAGARRGSTVYADGNGYYYHSERVKGNRRSLRCSEFGSNHCLARASMTLEAGAPIRPTANSPYHNHQPDIMKGRRLMMMARLKERATENVDAPISLLLNEEEVREPETAQTIALPNARKAMTRARGVGQPHTPNTLEQLREELVQPHNERFRLTLDGLEQFLLDGPIMEGNECVAEGFVSRRTIAHLARHPAEATHLMMDATFKTVPRRPQNMYQFFSIHVMYMDAAFPVAYFFMKRKTEEAYRRVLLYMRRTHLTWPVDLCTTDYELGLINAVRATFPNARILGCWFHYTQAIWRSVMREGLAPLAGRDMEARRVVKMIMALPHLPPHPGPPHHPRIPAHGIMDGIRSIDVYIREDPEIDNRLLVLVNKFYGYWAGVVGVENLSVFEAPHRTNNHLESFHSKLLAVCGVHLDVFKFIRKLQSIDNQYLIQLRRMDGDLALRRRGGGRAKANRNTQTIREALQNLVQGGLVITFLKHASHSADNLVDMGLRVHFIENDQEGGEVENVVAEEQVLAEEPNAPRRNPLDDHQYAARR